MLLANHFEVIAVSNFYNGKIATNKNQSVARNVCGIPALVQTIVKLWREADNFFTMF